MSSPSSIVAPLNATHDQRKILSAPEEQYELSDASKPRPQHIIWVPPTQLEAHPANIKLFGEQRLVEFTDLKLSLKTGFDPNRPIKIILREGRQIIIDGHRRQLAALFMGLRLIPVSLCHFNSEEEEVVEMITANLVRNHSHRSVGDATAVRLICQLRPRKVKRGRPSKKIQDHMGQDFGKSRREYYAALLLMSESKFRKLEYVLRHGTIEEQLDIDTKRRSVTAVYNKVHARGRGEDLSEVDDPLKLSRMARTAARTITVFLAAAGENLEMTSAEVEEEVDVLINRARQEVGSVVVGGATVATALSLLRRQLLSGRPATPDRL
jgi:hypothetical protein